MKAMIRKMFVFGTALTLLGGQITFAADQLRDQTRSRVKNETCIKDGSGNKIKNTHQNTNMKQNKKGSGRTLQSGK